MDSALNTESDLLSRCHLRHRLFSVEAGAISAASAFFLMPKAERRLTPWFSAPSSFCSGFSPSRWRCITLRPQSSRTPCCSLQSGVLLLGRGTLFPGHGGPHPHQLSQRPCHRSILMQKARAAPFFSAGGALGSLGMLFYFKVRKLSFCAAPTACWAPLFAEIPRHRHPAAGHQLLYLPDPFLLPLMSTAGR